jgi:hypothetical protein
VFDTYFAQHGLLAESRAGTMLHGTLELSAIRRGRCGRLAMGNGWLFPRTYSASAVVSSRCPARSEDRGGYGADVCGAGFIESFITRHTDMATGAKLAIIGLSAAFVLFYFVLWPWWLHRREARREPRLCFATLL